MQHFWGRICPVVVAASLVTATAGAAAAQDIRPEGWREERKGNLTVYTPPDLKRGEAFALVLEPPVDLARRDLSQWVTARSEKDTENLGTVVSRNKPVLSKNNGIDVAMCSLVYRTKTPGPPLMVSYIVARRAGGTGFLARILTTTDKETYQRYVPDATKAIVALAGKSETAPRVGSGSGSGSSSGSRSESGTATKRRPRGSDAYTRTGAGPKASEVFGVYSLMNMQTGVGGGFYMVHQPMVLLKDGTYFEDFDAPLGNFDVAAARAARPRAWGKWRRQGAAFQTLSSKGVWKTAKFYGPLPKARPGETLSGLYSTIGGGGDTAFGGSTMVVVTGDLSFLPNGQFKAGRFAAGMTPGVTTRSQNSTDGKYRLDGYTLTLTYRDGRTERSAFAFMDTNGKKDALYLNGSPYLKKK